jgi:transcription antitermination factor NusG
MPMAATDLKPAWYAIQVRPKHEEVTSTLLTYKGYETYVPQYYSESKRKSRARNKKRLLPGYVFCRFSPISTAQIGTGAGVVTTPGVLRIVGAGDVPIPIPDAEIKAFQRILSSDLTSVPWRYLQVGQQLNLSAGPLRGISGVLISADRRDRLVVSINLLQRSLAVDICFDWVRPLPEMAYAVAEMRNPSFGPAMSCCHSPIESRIL